MGIAIGVPAALGLSRLLEGLLHEVSPWDPWTYACVSAVVVVVGLLASFVSAWRANRIDPLESFRRG